MFGAAEGRLGIDVPVLLAQLRHQLFEPCRITEISCRSSAVEQPLAVELSEFVEELVAKHGAQHRNGQQKQGVTGVDPSLVVGR